MTLTPAQFRQDFPEFAAVKLSASASQVQVAGNVLTVLCVNTFQVGQLLNLLLFGTATFLNGLQVTVSAASGTQFSAILQHADYPPTADNGVVVQYQYPDSQINFYLNMGTDLFNPARWGKTLNVGLELFIAHNVSMEGRAQREAMAGGDPGISKGMVSSESADKGSISYDTGSSSQKEAGHWNLTIYGTRLIRLIRMFGAGPVQIGVCAGSSWGSFMAWAGPPMGWVPAWQ
jgi:hypothetical protein